MEQNYYMHIDKQLFLKYDLQQEKIMEVHFESSVQK